MHSRSRITILAVCLAGLLTLSTPANAGGPIGGDHFVIHNDGGVSEEAASVVYNAYRQEYLVVWEAGEIWGRRVSASGRLADVPFRISPTGEGVSPDVAYNSIADEYLVVWQNPQSVRAQRISATNALLGGVINIKVGYLPPPGVDGYYYDQPAVAYASTSDRYLVAYRYRHDSTNGSSVEARDCSSSGTPGTTVVIEAYSAVNVPQQPDLAYNRSRNEFLVAWQTYRATDVDVYGRRVKMTGGADVLGGEFVIANLLNADEVVPSVGAIPTVPNEGQYLVAWERDGDILAAAISWDGSVGFWRTLADTPLGRVPSSSSGQREQSPVPRNMDLDPGGHSPGYDAGAGASVGL